VLTAVGEGWSLTDPGSTNGTTLNGSREPLTPAVSVDIADGDQIHLGAWTTITLRAPA
jgi:pSer/pThr/pTyr-binding forkhead associated (FHA) protein